MAKLTKQIQNPGKTNMLSPKGILEALGLGMIMNFLSSQPGEQKTSMLSPEAILMMSVGIILDFLSSICAILIIALGAGLLLSKIVYLAGFIIVSVWSFFRGGGIKRGKGLSNFFKKYGINLAEKTLPVWGDFKPLWTITIFLELKS